MRLSFCNSQICHMLVLLDVDPVTLMLTWVYCRCAECKDKRKDLDICNSNDGNFTIEALRYSTRCQGISLFYLYSHVYIGKWNEHTYGNALSSGTTSSLFALCGPWRLWNRTAPFPGRVVKKLAKSLLIFSRFLCICC